MYGGAFVAALLLVMLYQEMTSTIFASFRVGLMVLLVVFWRQIVELLILNEFVHAMRRDAALVFRWRFAVLVVVLELFVIQQVPTMLLDVLND